MTADITHISKSQVRFIRSLQQKKERDREGLFVAEGDKCIGELLSGFELVTLVSSHALPASLPPALSASEMEISQMSSLRTPQGSIAVFRQRSGESADRVDGLSIALDGVQDPGNLGTIIRTCDWYGIRHIVCSRTTADCYNPKVVQATMGALARVQVHYVDLPQWLSSRPTGLPIYGTLLDGRNMYDDGAIADPHRGVIIMGNEGNGISAEVRRLITHPLYIPSHAADSTMGVVESLNVSIATAVIIAEFKRPKP